MSSSGEGLHLEAVQITEPRSEAFSHQAAEILPIPLVSESVLYGEASPFEKITVPQKLTNNVDEAEPHAGTETEKQPKKKKKPFLTFVKETLTDDTITWRDVVIVTAAFALLAAVSAATYVIAVKALGAALVIKLLIGAGRFAFKWGWSKIQAMLIGMAVARFKKQMEKRQKEEQEKTKKAKQDGA
jgi:hypothetical protein